ncbi:hypothetical protein QYE76_027231 [Lolium multiflorum]|uniref:Transposase (putative) gypsy type domain-containing protein n=1 Tax=Lolium multiflorum TaxID=4521 RepID=A0AAD8PMJ8_LOLMU|nr:hypothetical protein QYE76_027231 [Lolium multiflorum]
MATPLSSAPPPFIPINLDPSKDSGKEVAGTSAHPEKTSGADQTEHPADEAIKKTKARKRDSEAKGKWWPCTTTEMELKNLESEGFLQPGSWRSVPDEPAPAPRDDEMVLTNTGGARIFVSAFEFFLEILKTYGLQPHNISPNSVLAISNHVALCGPSPASSTSKPDPKEIINIDDLPEDPAHHGDSAKGTSSPTPPPDQPSSAFAEPTEEEQEQKVKLLQVTNATRVHLQPTPSFQKLTLSQRHAEVSAMLNRVWGKPEEEVRELADLEVA